MRDLLNADLAAARRMSHLAELCARFTRQPLHVTVVSLGDALDDPIDMEDYRRLHILISHLYLACGASIPLTTELRAQVNTAFGRRGESTTTQRR